MRGAASRVPVLHHVVLPVGFSTRDHRRDEAVAIPGPPIGCARDRDRVFHEDAMQQTENLNVLSLDLMPSPDDVKSRHPLSEVAATTVVEARRAIEAILDGRDRRLLLVVGPCSIHDPVAGLDYAQRLRGLAREVSDTFLLVMRVYFEKPRTSLGWKGFVNDPRMDDSFRIDEGMERGRRFLLDVNELGLPAATEALDPIA